MKKDFFLQILTTFQIKADFHNNYFARKSATVSIGETMAMVWQKVMLILCETTGQHEAKRRGKGKGSREQTQCNCKEKVYQQLTSHTIDQ